MEMRRAICSEGVAALALLLLGCSCDSDPTGGNRSSTGIPTDAPSIAVPEGAIKIAQDEIHHKLVYKSKDGRSYLSGFSKGTLKNDEIAAGQLIVKYQLGGYTHLVEIAERYSGIVSELDSSRELRLCLVSLRNEQDYLAAMNAFLSDADIDYAVPNHIGTSALVPNDPYYGMQSYGPKNTNCESAWDEVPVAARASITIAIIDSGVDLDHEDLATSIVAGHDFVNNDDTPQDDNGHGSHCAGLAAAIYSNGKGLAGTCSGCKIMPVKVMDSSCAGTDANLIRGLNWAGDHGAKIISLSLQGFGGTQELDQAIQDAIDHQVHAHQCVCVAAAGNDGTNQISSPGKLNNVICVGATDQFDTRCWFSNSGPQLDIVAPGSSLYSCWHDGLYNTDSGTSMATPVVAGICGLILAQDPTLTPAQVESILKETAKDLGATGRDDFFGNGIVDAKHALTHMSGGVNPPVGTPNTPPVDNPTNPVIDSYPEWDPNHHYYNAGDKVHYSGDGKSYECKWTHFSSAAYTPPYMGPVYWTECAVPSGGSDTGDNAGVNSTSGDPPIEDSQGIGLPAVISSTSPDGARSSPPLGSALSNPISGSDLQTDPNSVRHFTLSCQTSSSDSGTLLVSLAILMGALKRKR